MKTAVRRERSARLRLGYVGRLSQGDKSVMDMIPLCSFLARRDVDFELHVWGDGGSRPALEEGLRRYVDEGRVRLHGAVPQAELYGSAYPTLDVLVSFSRAEAFGIAIVEAMAHGVVPVTSRFVGMRSEGILEDGRNCLTFEYGDLESAAAAIQRLDENRDLLRAIGARAAEVRDLLSWERSMQEWVQAFEDAAAIEPRATGALPPKRSTAGRLERLGVPGPVIDLVRRARRAIAGVPREMIGGEEWPLFNRDYSAEYLEDVRQMSIRLDSGDGP